VVTGAGLTMSWDIKYLYDGECSMCLTLKVWGEMGGCGGLPGGGRGWSRLVAREGPRVRQAKGKQREGGGGGHARRPRPRPRARCGLAPARLAVGEVASSEALPTVLRPPVSFPRMRACARP
jgi:hypothetical protein